MTKPPLILQDRPWTSLQHSLEIGRRLISPKTGIIHSVIPVFMEPDDPEIHCMAAKACDRAVYSSGIADLKYGGAGLTADETLAAAIGETVERYCASYVDAAQLVSGSYNDLREYAVHPRCFRLYSDAQYAVSGFPFRPLGESDVIRWVWGWSLIHRQPRLVPAFMVYLSGRVEQDYGQTTSTGLACGNNSEEAILRGLYETVERDAFTGFWLNRLPMPRLDLDGVLAALGSNYYQWFRMHSIRHMFWDITTDAGVPVILAVSIGPSDNGDILTIGASCNLDPVRCARKALVEAAHGRSYVKFLMRKPWNCRQFDDLHNFEDHAQFYTRCPEFLHAFDFIFNTPRKTRFDQIPDRSSGIVAHDIRTCLELLKDKTDDIVAVDVTSPDINDAGYKVFKIVAPGLALLHGDHRIPYLGGRRLFDLPRLLGFADHPAGESTLNPFPHPFP